MMHVHMMIRQHGAYRNSKASLGASSSQRARVSTLFGRRKGSAVGKLKPEHLKNKVTRESCWPAASLSEPQEDNLAKVTRLDLTLRAESNGRQRVRKQTPAGKEAKLET